MTQLEQPVDNAATRMPARVVAGNDNLFLERSLEDPWPGRFSVWENRVSLLQQAPIGTSPAWQYRLIVSEREIPGAAPTPRPTSERDLPGDLKPYSLAEVTISCDVPVQVYRVYRDTSLPPELVLDLFLKFNASAKGADISEPMPQRILPIPREALPRAEQMPTKGE